jgi:hypothetical protein
MSSRKIETNTSAKKRDKPLFVEKKSAKKKVIREFTKDELDSVEKFADKALAPVDVDFTYHFLDRLTDPRNIKMITKAELLSFFKRLSRYKNQFMDFLRKYSEFVTTHKRYDINIPFVKVGNKLVAKTIMRKPNFLTSNPKFKFESYEKYLQENEIPKGKWINAPIKAPRGNELVKLVQIAYKNTPAGSFVNSLSDLTQSKWLGKDYDSDPELDVTIFYRTARGGESWKGYKIQGVGHDGSDESKKRVLQKLKELLSKNGWWVEASDALEHVLYKMGAPYIDDEVTAQKVFPNTDLKMIGDKGKYTRILFGSKRIKETIFGKPIVK